MKTFLVSIALFLSTSAFARQYIQCNTLDTNMTDVMVVNLQTPQKGTLFLSSGMQNPETERVLLKIKMDKIVNDTHIFKVVGEATEGEVVIPSEVIGKSANDFAVDLSFASSNLTFSCFSRIYND